MKTSQDILDSLKALSEALNLDIGPIVVRRKGRSVLGEIKVSYEGKPILTFVVKDDEIKRVRGLNNGLFLRVILNHLIKTGVGVDLEVNPNHASIMVFNYANPAKLTLKRGTFADLSILLLEALRDYYGV